MEQFIKTTKLGNLYYDKILFDSYYPILFTLKDDMNKTYICVCHNNDEKSIDWLLTKTSPSDVISLLTNKITMRQIFLLHPEARYSITFTNKEWIIEENIEKYWSENSTFLPDDEYMDAEEDEFLDEIEYYLNYSEDDIDVLFNSLSNSQRIDVKKYIIELIRNTQLANI